MNLFTKSQILHEFFEKLNSKLEHRFTLLWKHVNKNNERESEREGREIKKLGKFNIINQPLAIY